MIKRLRAIWNSFLNLPILKQLLAWSKSYSLPGFQGVPVYNIIVFVINETHKDNITTRANSVAFSFFLALFPFIIFLFTLLPLIPFVQEYMTDSLALLQQNLENIMPQNAKDYLIGMVEGIVNKKRSGLLSLGFILAVFFSSSGMLTLMAGFDKSYDSVFKQRGYFKKRLVALLLTLVLSLLFIFSFILIILGNLIVPYLDQIFDLPGWTVLLINGIKTLITVLLLYVGMTLIYRYGPSMTSRSKFVNAGAILATILSLITSLGFSYFVNNFGRYNELYGSIGALIVIMLWMQFNAFVILIGFELNAGIAVNKNRLMNIELEQPEILKQFE